MSGEDRIKKLDELEKQGKKSIEDLGLIISKISVIQEIDNLEMKL